MDTDTSSVPVSAVRFGAQGNANIDRLVINDSNSYTFDESTGILTLTGSS